MTEGKGAMRFATTGVRDRYGPAIPPVQTALIYLTFSFGAV
jgi:hypothetical protein